MREHHQAEWNPTSENVLRDQRAAYDAMREKCAVAYSDLLKWSVFRHADVLYILNDPESFSSTVSKHLSVPSGMDPPEHTPYRRIVEKYFTPDRMEAFEPRCRTIAGDLVAALVDHDSGDFMAEVALPYAVQAQCEFLGWPDDYQEPLIRWIHDSHAATLVQDRPALSILARQFEGFVDELIEQRLQTDAGPQTDLMASLMHETVWGRPLSHEEIASILRNWTAGEVGTMAAAAGIVVHFLAEHPDIQTQLRIEPDRVPVAVEEILRIDGPLVAARRITTRPVKIGGRQIDTGQRLTLMWISANRDERAFEDATSFRWDRDPSQNLLWGAGIHVCPGAPLARLEMQILLEELLSCTNSITLSPAQPAVRAIYPSSGFANVYLQVS